MGYQGKNMKNFIVKLIKLSQKHKQIILYLFFGVCTTLLNTLCYGALHDFLGVGNLLSTIFAWLVAVIFAFFTNKIYVFESNRKRSSEQLKEFTSFFGYRIMTGVLDVVIMVFAVDYMKWNSLFWKLISNIIVTIINYVVSKFMIFKKP